MVRQPFRCPHLWGSPPCVRFAFVELSVHALLTSANVITVLIRGEMYYPPMWQMFSNTTFPAMVAEIAAEAQAVGLSKRAVSDTTVYSPSAILCSDSIVVNTTMAEIFESIISTSRNISSMCTSLSYRCFLLRS